MHSEREVCEWRYERVTEAAALLVREGFNSVYSPITHTHPIDYHLAGRQSHDFWVNTFDAAFLVNSKILMVLMLPGWEDSKGIKMEIEMAIKENIPVVYAKPIYDEKFHLIALEHDVKEEAE